MAQNKQARGADLHVLVTKHWRYGDRLYGVVDAARDSALASTARDRYKWPVRWLFAHTPSHMAKVAPYLVPIEFRQTYPYPGSGYLDLWAQHLWRSAGILLITQANPDEAWEHLRSIFQVTTEDEECDYYFRFYDPRVFRTFQPTCTGSNARAFFGPVRHFLVESETPGKMLSFQQGRSGIDSQEDMLERSVQ